MATRTVRLDDESEELLDRLRKTLGLSVSAALKRGLTAADRELAADARSRPFEVYRQLDLGPGGYAAAPSRKAKVRVRELIARKHRR
jgi:hypothetical protein